MWLPDTRVLLTYRTLGSMLIFQYLYINYVPEQAPAVPRLNTQGVVGSGWGMGVLEGGDCGSALCHVLHLFLELWLGGTKGHNLPPSSTE